MPDPVNVPVAVDRDDDVGEKDSIIERVLIRLDTYMRENNDPARTSPPPTSPPVA